MDSALNKNEPELKVIVLPAPLDMLADRNYLLENAEDFVSGNTLDLSNTVRITENNTDLRRSQTLLSKLANIFINIL